MLTLDGKAGEIDTLQLVDPILNLSIHELKILRPLALDALTKEKRGSSKACQEKWSGAPQVWPPTQNLFTIPGCRSLGVCIRILTKQGHAP